MWTTPEQMTEAITERIVKRRPRARRAAAQALNLNRSLALAASGNVRVIPGDGSTAIDRHEAGLGRSGPHRPRRAQASGLRWTDPVPARQQLESHRASQQTPGLAHVRQHHGPAARNRHQEETAVSPDRPRTAPQSEDHDPECRQSRATSHGDRGRPQGTRGPGPARKQSHQGSDTQGGPRFGQHDPPVPQLPGRDPADGRPADPGGAWEIMTRKDSPEGANDRAE
jgi:hypothetical protein